MAQNTIMVDEITVTDIVREAGASRNSFYRNYQSIQEIEYPDD